METKCYSITLSGERLNEHIVGFVAGVIYAITGMPDRSYAWIEKRNGDRHTDIDATEEQRDLIEKAIGKAYPKATFEFTISE